MNTGKLHTGIVLAGGKSQRMGSDKAQLRWKGKAFIEYSIEALKPLVDELIIVGDPSTYRFDGIKTIPDLIPNSGPLAGLYTGLASCKNTTAIVLSCDLPLISTDCLKELLEQNKEEQACIYESNQQWMPLTGIYKKDTKDIALKLLNQGQRSMINFLKQLETVRIVKVDSSYSDCLNNINTPSELNELT